MTASSSEQMEDLVEKYVVPFYLELMQGNFLIYDTPERRRFDREEDNNVDPYARTMPWFNRPYGNFSRSLAHAANSISDSQLDLLLSTRNWRHRICAGWFIGISKRASFVRQVGELFLQAELVTAGQGFSAALGLIGTQECIGYLQRYLTLHLPIEGRVYDQVWVVGVLAHVQGSSPVEFLDATLWRDSACRVDPRYGIRLFSDIIAYLREHRVIDG